MPEQAERYWSIFPPSQVENESGSIEQDADVVGLLVRAE
jgi:hypothetical protein